MLACSVAGSVLATGSYVDCNEVTVVDMTKERNPHQTRKDRAQICAFHSSLQRMRGGGNGGGRC